MSTSPLDTNAAGLPDAVPDALTPDPATADTVTADTATADTAAPALPAAVGVVDAQHRWGGDTALAAAASMPVSTAGPAAESPEITATREALRARARALARVPEAGEERVDSIEVVEFELAHERYAIELIHIREVYPLRDLTPVPCTPDFVPGIINVRGRILTVLDIKRFFDLPLEGITDLNKVIIVYDRHLELGILCDAIHGVRAVAAQELQPSLATLSGVQAEYLRGVTPERLIILNVPALLQDPRLLVDEQAG